MNDAAPWQRSSYCESGTCVEVTRHPDGYGSRLIRSSKRPGDQIIVDADEWPAFKAGVIAGEFDDDPIEPL